MNKNIDLEFTPFHMNITHKHMEGNNGKGRYILLPGSFSRAKEISESFLDAKVITHPRGHNFHYGYLEHKGKRIDVASISSGMGTPSVEIILTELIRMGATKVIRVGTCGAMQDSIKGSDILVATAAIRDEQATAAYFPKEFPSVASFSLVADIRETASELKMLDRIKLGVFHTKSALYGREFEAAPKEARNKEYMSLVRKYNTIGSEMEASMLFMFGQYYGIETGAVAIPVFGKDEDIAPEEEAKRTKDLIAFSIEVLKRIK